MDKNIIEDAKKLAMAEIEQYGSPNVDHLYLSVQKARELAKMLGVDEDLAEMGSCLMDVKLGEALQLGKLDKHVKMSSDRTKEFLNEYDLDDDVKKKIINCVEAHHGQVPFICQEAEVTCNADCYRFIHPQGVFGFLIRQGNKGLDSVDALEIVEAKLEEKHNLLTLDICKDELEPYYQTFKKLIADAKK